MKQDEFARMEEQGEKHYWYAARRRLMLQSLKSLAPDGAGALKILDLACACGHNHRVLKGYGEYHGLDLSPLALAYCRGKGIPGLVRGDAARLPYRDGSFDVVLSLDVFEHIEDDSLAIAEVHRVLRPGGLLIFNVPALMSLFSRHDRAFHHHRRYGRMELAGKLEARGLSVRTMSFWSFFLFPFVYAARRILMNRGPDDDESDFHMDLPGWADALFRGISAVEASWIGLGLSFPVGVSLFGTAKKGA